MKISITKESRKNVVQIKKSIFGESRNSIADNIFAFLFAMTPILQHYKGILGNAGITVLVIVLVYFLTSGMFRKCTVNVKLIGMMIPLILFSIYKAFIHEINIMSIAQAGVIILFYLAAATKIVNTSCLLKRASDIAILASIFIIIQNLSYYLFGKHLQMVPTSLLLPESSQWILGAQTGRVGINGVMTALYRPSAFFLEPSHMFLYIFPILFIYLLSRDMNKWRFRRAILLSIGIILSTSGMGIAVTVAAWGLYFGLSSGKMNEIKLRNILKLKNIIIIILLFFAAIIVVFTVPTIRDSVERILFGNAISGRTSQATNLLKSLSGSELIIGVTSTTEGIEYNLSGFAATLYKFGIIGIILSYSLYVRSAIQEYAPYNWIGMVILAVSFFSAHTHGTIYMLYYVLILVNGADLFGIRKLFNKR